MFNLNHTREPPLISVAVVFLLLSILSSEDGSVLASSIEDVSICELELVISNTELRKNGKRELREGQNALGHSGNCTENSHDCLAQAAPKISQDSDQIPYTDPTPADG